MASMLQEAGLAEVLVVADVLKALEHDPSKVTYTGRAIAWNKLDAACTLGDSLLVAALQHHVRGHI